LITMFAIPLVSLVALWAFAATITIRSASNDHDYNVSVASLNKSAGGLSAGLPTEREETYLWLISGRKSDKAPLLATRALVDKAIPADENTLRSFEGMLSAGTTAELNTFFARLGQIESIRAGVDSGSMSPLAALQAYDGIIDAEYQFYDAGIQDRGAALTGDSVGASDAGYSLEMASREATLVAGALVDRGQLSAAARQLFIGSVASRRVLIGQGLALLPPEFRAGYLAVDNTPNYQRFQAMEDQISASTGSGPIPVNPSAWESASGAYLTALSAVEDREAVQLATMAGSQSSGLVTEAALVGGLGLLAVVVSVFLLLWFGRKVTGDLTRLHSSVRAMAEERLPRVVERLRRGDEVDVLAESPPPEVSTIEEISQIATSFATVQGAAVAAAVEQARMRKGVNRVFLNISMRSQSLLHRQLGMLDGMERRTSEPGALSDLFRLDHLTTRMRRHAEGLIILSGSTPGRGWRDPVPVIDVLRAAVAEVEDYVRVDVVSESLDLVAGNAVNDIIHLVAELVENATVFSPPNTRIEVRADRVGTGLVAEIEDRGLGLSQPELAEINRRLASPPEFDLANSEQLGLFVVSMLAARHQIKVSLRQSAYGGTTAILLLPFGVIVREEEAGSAADSPVGRGAGLQALPPGWRSGTGRLGPAPYPDWARDSSPFGAAGRHRLAAAATGRRVHTGEIPLGDDREGPPARWTSPPPTPYPGSTGYPASPPSPASPGEYQQQPQPRALPPAPWEVAAAAAASSSWPDAFQRDVTAAGTALSAGDQGAGGPPAGLLPSPVPASTPAGDPAAEAAARPAASHLGMPVRVPQASLAPQLRAGRDDDPAAPAREASDLERRAPEATRTMMMTMQQGWQRGRVDDLEDLDDASSQGNGPIARLENDTD
jgi:signal transduction histidine kinase